MHFLSSETRSYKRNASCIYQLQTSPTLFLMVACLQFFSLLLRELNPLRDGLAWRLGGTTRSRSCSKSGDVFGKNSFLRDVLWVAGIKPVRLPRKPLSTCVLRKQTFATSATRTRITATFFRVFEIVFKLSCENLSKIVPTYLSWRHCANHKRFENNATRSGTIH